MTRKTLHTVNLTPKRKRKDDGEEEDEDEAYARWADQWIRACVLELTEEQAFSSAIRDISFLSQIDVTFNFASTAA